jgi:lipopolysaccharide/colanic/teichoic acid biosynthesis glycosyltransferase
LRAGTDKEPEDSRSMRSLIAKRAFDLFFAALGMVCLTPLLLAIAACIKLDSQGPVFFRQERVGRCGKVFRIHKFRTMHAGAEKVGPLITRAGDSRVTRVGKTLRKYKLDELPQLIDVVSGEMSLVGARPEVPRYVQYYPPQTKALLLALSPGITDPAAIIYKREEELLAASGDPEREYVENILPLKLRYYEEYAKHRSMWSDIVIILRTLKEIFV